MQMAAKLPIIAIIGRANVGKSSLFNAVLERREAIVAREAGTTRDSITAKATFGGQDFWIVDTAGIKDPEDDFELTIQEQVKEAADSADVIWVVIEADTIVTEEDRRVAKMALKTRKPVFLIVNKADKAKKAIAEDYQRLGIKLIALTSATQNSGIDELLTDLIEVIPVAMLREPDNVLRVALLGRPNVGKSNLFNSLSKKQQAIVSDRAGTTRDINRTRIKYAGRDIEIMDTAGIRRNGRIEKGIEKFSVLRSLAAIEQSDICFLLIDANDFTVALDQKIAGMIKDAGKGLVLVISKWDALEDKTEFSRDAMAAELKHTYDYVPWAPLILTSAVTGQNVTKLFDLMIEIDAVRKTIIKTTELNRWLREVTASHPPAGLKNRSPRLNYIVQEADNPTNFKIYGSNARFLHWSYKRYMDRSLREKFGFTGTPLRFWFFDKHVTHKHGVSPTKEDNSELQRSIAKLKKARD